MSVGLGFGKALVVILTGPQVGRKACRGVTLSLFLRPCGQLRVLGEGVVGNCLEIRLRGVGCVSDTLPAPGTAKRTSLTGRSSHEGDSGSETP